jgi:hypothetical protein
VSRIEYRFGVVDVVDYEVKANIKDEVSLVGKAAASALTSRSSGLFGGAVSLFNPHYKLR